jgi:hypothetical protein
MLDIAWLATLDANGVSPDKGPRVGAAVGAADSAALDSLRAGRSRARSPRVAGAATPAAAAYAPEAVRLPDFRPQVGLFDDEGDEEGFGGPSTVDRQATDILMPGDGYVYESHYTSGLRIVTERSVPSGDLQEVAWFDRRRAAARHRR